MHARILVVEDDPRLAQMVQAYLIREGFLVEIEERGDRAEQRILSEQPDAVLLDLRLPGQDGMSVCRAVRPDYGGAILMMTARGDEVDEVLGLELGADDYLTKPVRPRVLLARLRAALRRRTPAVLKALRLGPLHIQPQHRLARIDGVALSLQTAEFDLLLFLARNAGQVVTREALYPALMGAPYDGLDRSMDLRVCRLRKKLGDDPKHPRWLKSIRGVGYLLVPA
ncbi:MAG: two-component system response regulator RstA [Cognaticolwellia sp.]|jgi:two-component system response regulator RstA